MRICIVVGTRPEIIKMSSIIRLCEKENIDYYIVHTGQHYSLSLDKIFFDELNLPKPKYNLEVGSATHSKQTASILNRIDDVLLADKPDIILVQGDTNSVLAAALAGSKAKIKVGHVEAGLRSFDWNMPEEINRVVADHISNFLYAPTENSMLNLIREGIAEEKIIVTGNTVTDALFENLIIAREREKDKQKNFDNYILATFHRPENVDNKQKLENIINALKIVSDLNHLSVIVPLHPRTRKMISEFDIDITSNSLKFIEPVGYLDFLLLESEAALILTDSGGAQEEACILKVPCVTLRENTERPETIDIGANTLAGTDLEVIIKSSQEMIRKSRTWDSPYGDGSAAEKIINHVLRNI
jgi:UDP-N-acetylglucosamine 2-epimerase (non-hydrolysing)